MSPLRNSLSIAALGLLSAALLACGAMDARAQDAVDRSVAEGREAFGGIDVPWYDAERDALQPIRFRPQRKPWLPDLSGLFTFLMWTFLALLAAAVLAILIHFARKQVRPPAAASHVARDQVLAADQVEALGFLAERPRGDLLGQARWHYQQGNYGEAIIYLFSYQLLELDKFSLIHLAKGKTNRQYLREASRAPNLRGMLEMTMLRFENVFFGRGTLDRAGFEACWNALPEFEQQLRAAQ
jgi:hypothetical protein